MSSPEEEEQRETRSAAPSETTSHQSRPRTRSVKSWRSGRSRTRSRPRSPDSHLHRIYSGGFHDDHGHYLHHADIEAGQLMQPGQMLEEDYGVPENEEKGDSEEDGSGRRREEEESRHSHDSTHEKPDGEKDLEKATPPSLSRQSTRKSTRSRKERDPNMVSWEGADDPENPRNWKRSRKWAAVLVVSSFTFISPVSSSMVAPALPAMNASLGTTNEVLSQMMLSIFLLAYAFGPLFLGPLSEMYGRVPVLQLANLFFLIFNLVCGFAQNTGEMIAFRFLAGLGGSAPLAIGGGILADCFPPEERGQAIAIYSLAPLIGPAVGPIAGGFIAENTTWRWVFWAVSIADAVIQLFGLWLLQETWAPKLLENKAKRLRKETGNENLYAEVPAGAPKSKLKKLETSLVRPFRLLFTQPIVILLAIYMAYLYGLVYLVISSFPTLFTDPNYYNESVGIGGLNYLALAIGYFIGAQLTSRFNDLLYRRLKHRNGGKGRPEFRTPLMIPCAILLPVGFFWYGWSAEARLFWIMPDIGAAILAAGTIAGYQAIQTYIIDSYTLYAASAVASITTLRSLAGFGFPLFAPAMYNALGYGWGNSLLAFVAIAIGFPAPAFFWFYGQRLRERSPFAAG